MDLNQTIIDNMGLVYKQLNKFHLSYDADAFSFSMEALMKAAKTFDTSKGIKFSTYASVCIYNALAMYLRSQNRKNMLQVSSYDAPMQGNPNATYAEYISDWTSAEDVIIIEETRLEVNIAFDELLDEAESSAVKLVLTIWRDSGFTARQPKIAEEAGVSQGYVSRILQAAKLSLKEKLEDIL